jgi:DNA-binding NarL/FixJ family response regulator
MHRTRVLIVDDHPFFRAGIVQWLECQSGYCCCGEADSVAGARQAVAKAGADVVLVDLQLSDGDGLGLIQELAAGHPGLRILAVSQHDEDTYAHRALKAGARGYIMKSEATEVVLQALEAVMKGEVYLSRPAAARLLHNLFPDPASDCIGLARLTDRELQIFQLLGSGCPPRDIATRLKISPKTVDTYREHLKDKLRLKDGAALTRAATLWVENGRLKPSSPRPG